MIIYFDGPTKSVTSLIEYDCIKRLPSQYSFNLLTKDKKSNKKNAKEKNDKTQINSNLNNIQRELINLLSNDLELNFGNEEFQRESNPEINEVDNNISYLNKNLIVGSNLMNDIRYMNNPLNKEIINKNSYNANNQKNLNKNRNNKNKNDNIGYNICSNIENSINNNINNPVNFLIKNQVNYDSNNAYFNSKNISPFIINNPINNFNKSNNNNALNINNYNHGANY